VPLIVPEGVDERQSVAVGDVVALSDPETLAQRVGEVVPHAESDPVGEGDPLPLSDGDAVAQLLGDAVTEPL